MWTCDNLAEDVSRRSFLNGPSHFYFQVRIFELRVICKCSERGRKTASDCGQQQVFRRPPAFDASELRGAVKWIAFGAESQFAIPVRPEVHQALIRWLWISSMLASGENATNGFAQHTYSVRCKM